MRTLPQTVNHVGSLPGSPRRIRSASLHHIFNLISALFSPTPIYQFCTLGINLNTPNQLTTNDCQKRDIIEAEFVRGTHLLWKDHLLSQRLHC